MTPFDKKTLRDAFENVFPVLVETLFLNFDCCSLPLTRRKGNARRCPDRGLLHDDPEARRQHPQIFGHRHSRTSGLTIFLLMYGVLWLRYLLVPGV